MELPEKSDKLTRIGVLHLQAAGNGGRQARQAKKMDWFEKNDWYGGVVTHLLPVEERKELYFCSSLSGGMLRSQTAEHGRDQRLFLAG